jgi:hypothetical protein
MGNWFPITRHLTQNAHVQDEHVDLTQIQQEMPYPVPPLMEAGLRSI